MNKKVVLLVIAVLCLVAAGAMYVIGDGSSHLSELKDFFWTPLPLGVACLILAFVGGNKSTA